MKYIFIIDPGHRKDTPGKNSNGLYEYEFNEDVAKRLERKLVKYGEVFFTIETKNHPYSEITAVGRSQNLNYRTNKANQIYYEAIKKYGKDNMKIIFISIHANAFSNPSVSGYEIFVYKHGGQAHELAKKVHKQAQLVLGVGSTINNRKIKEGNFAVLRNTKMPALLIEHEFYTNAVAAKKLKDNIFRDECAKHIELGVLDYMGIVTEEDRLMEKEIDKIKERLNIIEEHLKFPKEEVKPEPSTDTVLNYNRALKYGMTGSDVSQLQTRLKELGFYIGNIDGSFGPATDRAVRAYQSANSLSVDGSVGPATVTSLNSKKKDNIKEYEVLKPDNQTTIVKIPRKNIEEIQIIHAKTNSNREKLSSMMKRTGVDLIISGGLWWNNVDGKSHPLNLLISDGKQINEGIYSRFGLQTYPDKTYKFDWYKNRNPKMFGMLGGSPSLVIDSKLNIDAQGLDPSINNNRHPRAATGMCDDYFYFVTIDGRRASQGMFGMTNLELANYMLSLGCKWAMGGDGGDTVRVENIHGPLNNPREDRAMNNAVGIKLKEI